MDDPESALDVATMALDVTVSIGAKAMDRVLYGCIGQRTGTPRLRPNRTPPVPAPEGLDLGGKR